jgi:two-component system, chemotaxis family, protein-glutamate methylesterase/glutaminase
LQDAGMKEDVPRHDIIAIGGSAGSIEVLKTICAAFPADFSAAVFVVVHIGAESKNLLAKVIGKSAALPMRTALDREPVRRGHIYVAPADHHLLVLGDAIRLGRGPRENRSRPAIDALFRSVAASYGPRAIAVVLSGYLNDGAAGLTTIKRCGGITVVQNPGDAQVPDMPNGALCASDIDYRASASELGELLVALAREPAAAGGEIPDDVRLEIDIALGRPSGPVGISRIGRPSTLTCPACGGVMSQIKQPPLRFRCQVGHSYTAEVLAAEQESAVDEALRVALRIIEERLVLLEKMAADAQHNGIHSVAERYLRRAAEYRNYIRSLQDVTRSSALPADVQDRSPWRGADPSELSAAAEELP